MGPSARALLHWGSRPSLARHTPGGEIASRSGKHLARALLGLGFRVQGLGFRGVGFRVQGLGFRGVGFRVQDLGFRGLGV